MDNRTPRIVRRNLTRAASSNMNQNDPIDASGASDAELAIGCAYIALAGALFAACAVLALID